jgi:hypothetical protein
MRLVAYVLLGGSVLAFAFLAYSLANLEKLGIGPAHPRVLVEAGLGVILLLVGVLLAR